MDAVLLENWSEANGDFGYSLPTLLGQYLTDESVDNPYFFFEWELDNIRTRGEYWRARRHKQIRHCTIRNGKFYDYMVDREFNSLLELATDSHRPLNSIMYGTNRMHRGYRSISVTITFLVNFIEKDLFRYIFNNRIIRPDTKCVIVYNDVPEIAMIYDRNDIAYFTTCIVYRGMTYYRKSDLPNGAQLYVLA